MHILKRLLPVFMLLTIVLCLFSYQLMSYPTQGERIAERALEYLDVPYVLFRKDPKAFDCSGFLLYLFAEEGIDIPHSAEYIGTNDSYPLITDIKALRTGDVVCFDTVDDRDPSDHVGIYLSNNKFVHASSNYGKVVISEIADLYLEAFTGARRIADTDLCFQERLDLFLASVNSLKTVKETIHENHH